MYGNSPDEVGDKLIEQVNSTPWVWTQPCLTILGASRGYPKQWLIWGKKHERYFESMDEGAAYFKKYGFIDLTIGGDFIPNFWRPLDGAWAKLIDGFDGPQATTLDASGQELDAQGIEAPSGGETLLSGSTEGESPVPEGHAP